MLSRTSTSRVVFSKFIPWDRVSRANTPLHKIQFWPQRPFLFTATEQTMAMARKTVAAHAGVAPPPWAPWAALQPLGFEVELELELC